MWGPVPTPCPGRRPGSPPVGRRACRGQRLNPGPQPPRADSAPPHFCFLPPHPPRPTAHGCGCTGCPRPTRASTCAAWPSARGPWRPPSSSPLKLPALAPLSSPVRIPAEGLGGWRRGGGADRGWEPHPAGFVLRGPRTRSGESVLCGLSPHPPVRTLRCYTRGSCVSLSASVKWGWDSPCNNDISSLRGSNLHLWGQRG